MQEKLNRTIVLLISLLLLSCGSNQAIAPVSSKEAQRPTPRSATQGNQSAKKAYHRVQAGETLYSIAWSYGYDPSQVAAWNNIKPPYRIFKGQLLQVVPPPAAVIAKRQAPQNLPSPNSPPITSSRIEPPRVPPVSTAPAASASVREAGVADSVKIWKWPTQGEVVRGFSVTEKGLSIAGKESQPIHAAAAGRVVYRGSGLIGLGELVIVKHDKSFLSAYAHNKKILVKEGEQVALGQAIAEMGKTGAERVMLYFEIRKDGKPVDPLLYLPRQR